MYDECRALMHAWDHTETEVVRRNVIMLKLSCSRCPVDKRMTIDARTGELISFKYTYPEGYLNKGKGRIPKAESRKVFVNGLAVPRLRVVNGA